TTNNIVGDTNTTNKDVVNGATTDNSISNSPMNTTINNEQVSPRNITINMGGVTINKEVDGDNMLKKIMDTLSLI
ncbi:MAG: hypothetical protein ACRCR5_09625, partial [Lactococcus garvieae]